jgi:glycosyltransferase 2 family protein
MGLAALCLVLVLRKIDWPSLELALSRLRAAPLLIALGLAVLHGFILAWKWRVILQYLEPRIAFMDCFWSLRLGFFFNGILPVKMGEAVRVWFIHQRSSIHMSAAVGSSIGDRLIEFLSLMLLFFLALSTLSISEDWIPFEILLLIPLAVIGIFFILRHLPQRHSVSWISLIFENLHRMRSGFSAVSQPRVFLPSFLIAGLGWSVQVILLLVLSRALQLSLSWAELSVMMVGISLASALPSAPSNMGTFEFAAVFVLTKFFHISHEEAFALALIYHFVQLLPTWVIGGIGYFRFHKELQPQGSRPN